MCVKISVFYGQHRVNHHLWNFFDGCELAPLFSKFSNQQTFRGKHAQWQNRSVIGQIRNIWQIWESDRQRNGHYHQQAQEASQQDTATPQDPAHQHRAGTRTPICADRGTKGLVECRFIGHKKLLEFAPSL